MEGSEHSDARETKHTANRAAEGGGALPNRRGRVGTWGYRMATTKTPRSMFGGCGQSVGRTVVCPNRWPSDPPSQNAIPTIATKTRPITRRRILTNLRAEEVVFMALL